MPFLVDSVTGALSPRNLDVNLLVHPLVVVRREPLGALEEVRVGLEPEDAAPGDLVESWIRIEIDRDPRRGRARASCAPTWPGCSTTCARRSRTGRKMRTQALALADELGSAAAAGAGQGHHRLRRAAALAGRRPLHLPGYREYRAGQGDDGEELLQAVPRHRPGHPARRPDRVRGCSAR